MNIVSIQYAVFDDAATLAMGKAFDQACKSLRNFGSAPEIIATLIIAAAKNGELDPASLHEEVLAAFGLNDTSMIFVGVGSARPDPTYALITHAA